MQIQVALTHSHSMVVFKVVVQHYKVQVSGSEALHLMDYKLKYNAGNLKVLSLRCVLMARLQQLSCRTVILRAKFQISQEPNQNQFRSK